MYKNFSNKREVLVFRRFGRKGYSLFACLGREVLIGTLSVATLAHAKADSVSVKPLRKDTTATMTDREMTLEEVSVTGSRAPLALGRNVRMVSVLDKAAIAAAPAQSVNDLLKYAAGVDVRQRGPIGAQTDISIRGGNNEQMAILLNGINICDPQTGHNAFDFPVDISEIERIEVLKGPAGRVYGTSSLTGAINIVTRTPERSSIDAHAEGGSFGYASAGTRVNVAQGQWNNQLSGSYTRSDGYSRNKQGGLNADYQGGKAFYQGNYLDEDVCVRWHAGMSVKDFGSNTFYGAAWDDQFEHTMKTFTAIQAENRHGKLHIKPSVYWNRSADRFELYRGTEANVPFNYHRSDVFGVNLNSYFDWFAGRTAIGAELRNEDLVSTNLGESLDRKHHVGGTDRDYEYGLNRTNINLTAEHNIIVGPFTLSAGITAAKNSWSNAAMRVYPGFDASCRIGGGWRVYASYNTSQRMPSVTELYYSVGGHKADKHLEPEEMAAIEAGVELVSNGIRASASVFHNHYKNMIDWTRNTADGPDAPWQSVNFTKINAMGAEAELQLDFRRLLPAQHVLRSMSVEYCYIDQDKAGAEGIESKYSLEYLKHKLTAGLQTGIWRDLCLGINVRWQERTGTYTDTEGAVRAYAPYTLVDARLAWNAERYKVYVEANNLFDKSYVDYGNVPQPGMWIIAGAAININL